MKTPMGNDRRDIVRLNAVITRLCVWAALAGILYVLRAFFLLIFLTFVFAYIESRVVDRLAARLGHRTICVTVVGLVFLALLTGILSFIVPSIGEQAKVFANNYPLYLKSLDSEISALADRYPIIHSYLPEKADSAPWSLENSTAARIVQQLLGYEGELSGPEQLKNFLDLVRGMGARVLPVVSAFLLSLLFSFLIVLDLPRLTRSIKDLANTKVAFIYEEVSQSIYNFCRMLGRALEAQFFIAIANTALTALGLWLIGIRAETTLLSMVVFFCSFIPIAGVFLSSIPICLVALQTSGIGLMAIAIGLITVIHLVEAYILNPKIYGHHLRANPVLVLIVLTVSGKLFGVWGLILGLPVCTYFFRSAIRYQTLPPPS